MIIKESCIQNNTRDPFSVLEGTDTMSSINSVMTPDMVNIKHIGRIDKDLIQLESFVAYSESNGIDDGGIALQKVCEANGVSRYDKVGFMVNEASLYLNDGYVELIEQVQYNGFPVHIAPISSVSIYYRGLEEALQLDSQYTTFEESANLMAFCEFNPFEVGKEYLNKGVTSIKNFGSSVKDRVSKNVSNIKSTLSASPTALANKLAAIRKSLGEKSAKLKQATGDAKVFLTKQVAKLKKAYSTVKEKLIQAKNTVKNKAISAKDYVADKATSAKNYVANKATDTKSYISNKASSLKSKLFD